MTEAAPKYTIIALKDYPLLGIKIGDKFYEDENTTIHISNLNFTGRAFIHNDPDGFYVESISETKIGTLSYLPTGKFYSFNLTKLSPNNPWSTESFVITHDMLAFETKDLAKKSHEFLYWLLERLPKSKDHQTRMISIRIEDEYGDFVEKEDWF